MLGISRIANVTGLDRVGVPVFQVVRPGALHMSVSLGKGPTAHEAEVSALMESLEMVHAERLQPFCRARAVDVFRDTQLDVLDLAHCELGIKKVKQPLNELEINWSWGKHIINGKSILLPHGLFSLNSSQPGPDYGVFAASSAGLAAGNTRDEAVLHGLYEVVERDAVSRWFCGVGPLKGAARVYTNSQLHPELSTIFAAFQRASLEYCLLLLPSRVGIAVAVCLIWEQKSFGGAGRFHLGSGCDIDPVAAATKAVLEAAQTRLTQIVGAREDLASKSFIGISENWVECILRRIPNEKLLAPVGPTVPICLELRLVIQSLVESGFRDIFAIDHNCLLDAFKAVHLYVPGLFAHGGHEGQ